MQVRHYVSNYATFLRHAALDWEEHFVSAVHNSEEPVPLLRCRAGCAFCARSFWTEEMSEVFLHGPENFMQNADAVWQLLSVERYHQRWPLIPLKELEASAVDVERAGSASWCCCTNAASALQLFVEKCLC